MIALNFVGITYDQLTELSDNFKSADLTQLLQPNSYPPSQSCTHRRLGHSTHLSDVMLMIALKFAGIINDL